MTIEKIHSMLRLVASAGEHRWGRIASRSWRAASRMILFVSRYEMTVVQLRTLLQRMCDEEKLEKFEGAFQLKKA
jgi:hypothetical protein